MCVCVSVVRVRKLVIATNSAYNNIAAAAPTEYWTKRKKTIIEKMRDQT